MVPQRPCCSNGFPQVALCHTLASILLLCAQHQDHPDTGAGVTVMSCDSVYYISSGWKTSCSSFFGHVSVEAVEPSDLSVALLLLAGPQLLCFKSSCSTPSLKATSQRSSIRSATRWGRWFQSADETEEAYPPFCG